MDSQKTVCMSPSYYLSSLKLPFVFVFACFCLWYLLCLCKHVVLGFLRSSLCALVSKRWKFVWFKKHRATDSHYLSPSFVIEHCQLKNKKREERKNKIISRVYMYCRPLCSFVGSWPTISCNHYYYHYTRGFFLKDLFWWFDDTPLRNIRNSNFMNKERLMIGEIYPKMVRPDLGMEY